MKTKTIKTPLMMAVAFGPTSCPKALCLKTSFLHRLEVQSRFVPKLSRHRVKTPTFGLKNLLRAPGIWSLRSARPLVAIPNLPVAFATRGTQELRPRIKNQNLENPFLLFVGFTHLYPFRMSVNPSELAFPDPRTANRLPA